MEEDGPLALAYAMQEVAEPESEDDTNDSGSEDRFPMQVREVRVNVQNLVSVITCLDPGLIG